MKRLRIGIVDLVSKRPTRDLHARVMNANFHSIMPHAIAVWCERAGHEVNYVCYTGLEDLQAELPQDLDLVFISAFTAAAQLAYALSNRFRSKGAVTVLGGPHARAFPQDAGRYFDYVLGLTDEETIADVLHDCAPHGPGVYLSASRQPTALPGVAERWKFIEPTIAKSLTFQLIPVLGSLGCPYTCDFCVDSKIAYQPVDLTQLKEDLTFLLSVRRKPRLGWYDPNFGVRFDNFLDAIEEVVPPGRMMHAVEMSLSLVTEPRLKRLQKNGFVALLPGIESWYEYGNKSKTRQLAPSEKLRQVADHVNMILRHIPYVQANFLLGLDCDEGDEPFELTKQFIDLVPGAYPALSPITVYGKNAPLNERLVREERVIPIPFHFLNNRHTNLIQKNYGTTEFYRRVMDLQDYAFSRRAISRRFAAQGPNLSGFLNLMRGISADGRGRSRYYRLLCERLETDQSLLHFFEKDTDRIPDLFVEELRQDLGPMWDWLPTEALKHDPMAELETVAVSEIG